MSKVTYTEISEAKHTEISSAPNGSTRNNVDHYTTVIERQDWANIPENGIYAGCSYKITTRYISSDPNYRGQSCGSSSSPWI